MYTDFRTKDFSEKNEHARKSGGIRSAKKLFQGYEEQSILSSQKTFTTQELNTAACRLEQTPAWREVFRDAVQVRVPAVGVMHVFFVFLSWWYRRFLHLSIPFTEKCFRHVVTTIFTNLPRLDGVGIYKELGSIYGFFHAACVQYVPVSKVGSVYEAEEIDFSDIKRKLPVVTKVLPRTFFTKDAQWQSNDFVSRQHLAEHVANHIKWHLEKYPHKKLTILEPGGGTGELSILIAKRLIEDGFDASTIHIVVRELSSGMVQSGKKRLAKESQALQKMVMFELGSAVEPYKQEAGREVIASVSSFTAGAMGNMAVPIFKTALQDTSKDGIVVFTDFADNPPQDWLETDAHEGQRSRIAQRERSKRFFEKFGFDLGLAMIYFFWGSGAGHDTRKIWDIVYTANKHFGTTPEKVHTSVRLRPFALIPFVSWKEKVRVLCVPGYYEATVMCPGMKEKY